LSLIGLIVVLIDRIIRSLLSCCSIHISIFILALSLKSSGDLNSIIIDQDIRCFYCCKINYSQHFHFSIYRSGKTTLQYCISSVDFNINCIWLIQNSKRANGKTRELWNVKNKVLTTKLLLTITIHPNLWLYFSQLHS
jgi:hypothetical protein